MSKEFANPVDNSHTSSTAESVSLSAFQQLVSSEISLVNRIAAMIPDSLISPDFDEITPITAELKTAVDNSSTVTVKFSSSDTTNVDLVIKRDGTIEHYLNMDPNSYVRRNLIVAIEGDSNLSLPMTEPQSETLRELSDYCKFANKDFSLEQPTSSDANARNLTENTERRERRNYSLSGNPITPDSMDNASSTPQSVAPDSFRPRPVERNHIPTRTSASDNSGDPSSALRFSTSEQRTRAGTASDTSYWHSPRYDWTNVDLFELLTDWFSADPQSFKKLMPGLYKKLVGANGKIDPKKLRHMVDQKDPLLTNLKGKLPAFADSFHSTNQSRKGNVATSDCAVNSTGAVLADKAAQVSDELGGSGYCAKGVSFAIERATGKVIWGNANDMRESLPNQGFTVANSKDLKVGQVVHVYWTPEVYAQEQARRGPCANYGDIAVIGKGSDGQLYAYNDAATPLNDYLQKSRYDWDTLKVFNPPNV